MARLRAHRGSRVLRPARLDPRVRPRLGETGDRRMLASNPLIQVTPGLMIWTIICFLITFFVLKKVAFGRIQATIDERRERIQNALDEADRARDEARSLVEEHRKLIGQAKSEGEEILAEARRIAESQRERVREETEEDRQR